MSDQVMNYDFDDAKYGNTYDYDILILFPDNRRETLIGGHWTIHPV